MRKAISEVRLIFWPLLILAISPKVQAQGFQAQETREAGFELFLSQGYDEKGSPEIALEIAIPYKRLVFFLREGRYEARYRVFLEIMTASGERVKGSVWEESISTDNFRETGSMTALARSTRRIPVEAGEYRVAARVEVLDTSRSFAKEGSLRIIGEAGTSLDISAPSFFAVRRDSSTLFMTEGALSLITSSIEKELSLSGSPTSFVCNLDVLVRVRFDVTIPEAAETNTIFFSMRAKNSAGDVVQYYRAKLENLPGRSGILYLDIPIDNWRLGKYVVEGVIEAGTAMRRMSESGTFLVALNKGLFGIYLEDLSQLVSLVMNTREAKSISEAPPGERFERWSAMWSKLDPTPETDANEALMEFFSRLRYVLENFSTSEPGFRTDRGKTYISEGPPDRVERRGESSMRSYELWYYDKKGVVFIFEDVLGTGDYRLLTTRLL